MAAAPPVPPPPGVDRWSALLSYEGEARELLARLKYRNDRTALGWLADGMAALVVAWVGVAVARAGGAGGGVAVTWAPTSAVRVRERGFDQAELLARAVSRRLGLRCEPMLRRAHGPPQTGRPAASRLAAPPRFGVRVRGSAGPVLLVDDVATTGATLSAAGRALMAAGGPEVYALVAGRRR